MQLLSILAQQDFIALVIKSSGGDEVITTPMTFASTVNVIEHHNAKPIFVDIDKWSMNIDASLISKFISKNTELLCQYILQVYHVTWIKLML